MAGAHNRHGFVPSRWRLIRIIQGRPRLFIGIAAGVIVGLFLPAAWRVTTRLLIAWNVSTLLYIFLSGFLMFHATPESIKRRARVTDEGKFLILILTIVAAIASIGAIVAQLSAVKDLSGLLRGAHVALAGLTIVSGWFFIHLSFALHYAHEYFDEMILEAGKPAEQRGGLNFPGTTNPDYFDFLYFSFVIGVASQTADVAVTSKAMRRTTLVHCVLAFFFNSAVLALTVNIGAGLI
jgi:uncharacterized membrane protein